MLKLQCARLITGIVFGTCLFALTEMPTAAADAPATSSPIKVVHPRLLPAQDIPATRTPLGIPNDYKPWIVQQPNGELMIVAFCFGGEPSNKLPAGTPYLERAVFWRSNDAGKTWSAREERPDIHGREFSLTCLADGTLLMPCHFLSNDAANKSGYTYSKIFRSTDAGKTWTEQRIGPEQFPEKAETMCDWTPLEIPDPDRPGKTLVQFGVSMQSGGPRAPQHVYLWRSHDSGATWDKTLVPDTDRWTDVDGFFSQSVSYRTSSGILLHTTRVDASGPHWKLPDAPGAENRSGDQDDRTMLWRSTSHGKTWRKHRDGGRFGTYGEMYPRFLQLADGRLLLTFTVRSNATDGHPLGLRAIVSDDEGDTWDFTNDRLVLSDRNHGASGGGFGNTVQNADGSLVSCYSYRGTDDKTHIETVHWQLPGK